MIKNVICQTPSSYSYTNWFDISCKQVIIKEMAICNKVWTLKEIILCNYLEFQLDRKKNDTLKRKYDSFTGFRSA